MPAAATQTACFLLITSIKVTTAWGSPISLAGSLSSLSMKVALGSRKDRHENIGRGYVGLEAFRAIMNDDRLKGKSLNSTLTHTTTLSHTHAPRTHTHKRTHTQASRLS